ncbi:MAG: GNAT family N-acetyltransferase [Anaerolineae bacterium]
MLYLETERLILVQTPLEVLQARLEQESFTARVELPGGTMDVTFPAEWPGEALDLIPAMIEQYRVGEESIPWGGTVIEREECAAVGLMGFKGLPDDGALEIGYGINPSYRNRGYATEMVEALTEWALSQPAVRRVIAECRTDNAGSIRVLEKAGFERTGRRVDEEDGPLIVWQRVDQD